MVDATVANGDRGRSSTRRAGRRARAKQAAFQSPPFTSYRWLLAMALLSLLLKSVIFAPLSIWPAALFCFVPWLVAVGASSLAPRVYFISYCLGLAFFLINVRWMIPATFPGYIALSVYLAAYFPLIACPLRHVIRRRRWPLAIWFPIIWVGAEMIRAVALSGFPWFFLSHAFYRVLPAIQVSDLVGAYGVSFVIAAINGVLADLVLARLERRRRVALPLGAPSVRIGAVWVALLVVVDLGYGVYQLNRDTVTPGPRVAIIQGDYLSLVHPELAVGHDRRSDRERMLDYVQLMEEAGAERPDLFLLPESPWAMILNDEGRGMNPVSRESFTAIQQLSSRLGALVVTGCTSYERHPYDLKAPERFFNSAAVFYPDGREPGRYDKIHLVYFGEVVPFRFTRLHWLYLKLNALMPFSGPDGDREFSLFRGDGWHVFSFAPQSAPDATYRFGIPICYEDVMPYVARQFVTGDGDEKRVDMLLNISNDGWFGRGIQQPQHLAICAFRAVENRVGIARSVNTGNSGFIDPSGRIHDFPQDPHDRWPGKIGYSVARVFTDSRHAFYSRHGDWFAWSCAVMWLLIFIDYWMTRIRTRGASNEDEMS